MVVLTPNDQIRNTAYRVSDHNLITICQELQRGMKLLRQMRPRSFIRFKSQPATGATDELARALDLLE